MPNFASGLILAAGGSRRLGTPKQLLPYRGRPLLAHVLEVARRCDFDQLLVVLGGAADEVRARIDLRQVDVIENRPFEKGCSSSIAAALTAIDPRCDELVLMLGDQPGVDPATVAALRAARGAAPIAVCLYDDGRGHPFAFGREAFGDLAALHGDKAVWKLVESRPLDVAEVCAPGRVPPDVDTWDDYAALIAS